MKINVVRAGFASVVASVLFLAFIPAGYAFSDCKYLPYQRSDADLPVESGRASLPKPYPDAIILHVVNYGTTIKRRLIRDKNRPRLHSHIWLVNRNKCKKLTVLPLPINASINVQAVRANFSAMPINRLANGNLEIRYVFAVPNKPHSIIIRTAVVNKKWQVVSKHDIEVVTKGDARKIALLADWNENGKLVDLSEPAKKKEYLHHTVVFANNNAYLFRYTLTQPEAYFSKGGMLFDDTRPYKLDSDYPRYALLTSFSPQLKYYRQFTVKMFHPQKDIPHYVLPIEKQGVTLFQVGSDIMNSVGVLVYQPKLEKPLASSVINRVVKAYKKGQRSGEVLPDYSGKDQLTPTSFTSYRFQNGKWVKDLSLRPVRLSAKDIVKNHYRWP